MPEAEIVQMLIDEANRLAAEMGPAAGTGKPLVVTP